MQNKSIDKKIISLLEKGPIDKRELIEKVSVSQGATVQGVYKELRRQLSKGVVLLHKGAVSLNLLFINKEYDRWSSILRNYETERSLKDHFLDLRNGESIILKFKNLNDLDAYWVHAFFVLEKKNKKTDYSYSVIPHDWFFYARKETDAFWTKGQKEKSRIILTHPLDLDKEVANKRRLAGYDIANNLNPFSQSENIYYTLIGDFIFKITLNSKINKELIHFIRKQSKLKNIDYIEINNLINKKTICTMKITRNANKCKKMISKCKKYFE